MGIIERLHDHIVDKGQRHNTIAQIPNFEKVSTTSILLMEVGIAFHTVINTF